MPVNHPLITSLWSQYKSFVARKTLGKHYAADKTLLYWQNWVFTLAITYALPISVLILIPCVILEIWAGHYYIAISDLFSTGLFALITLNPRLSLHLRKMLVSVGVTLLAISMLVLMGAVTMGFIYLLAISAFISLQFSNKFAYGSIVFNGLVCALLAALLYFKLEFAPQFVASVTLNRWLIYSPNFLFMNLVVVGLIRQLLSIIATDITQQLHYTESIENNNKKLLEIAHMHSHIVRVPLANIKGLSALLTENIPTESDKTLLVYLEDSVKQLDEVINEIVTSTKTPHDS